MQNECGELQKGITSGKTQGSDGIPAEKIKCGGQVLIQRLHELLKLCWRDHTVLQEIRELNTIHLYKNKWDKMTATT